MIKLIYVLRDELTGEIINTFMAHNDEVAKIIVERSIDKQPLLSDISLYCVSMISFDEHRIKVTTPAQGYATFIEKYHAPKKDKKRR